VRCRNRSPSLWALICLVTSSPWGPGFLACGVGDQVYGVTNPQFIGAYAEYALAFAAMIPGKPTSLTYIEAASVPVICRDGMAGFV
jgi:hypothetical protein